MTRPQASVRRARRTPDRATDGYIVTWDVNSRDRAASGRVYRFIFGYEVQRGDTTYRYPGLVGRDGVRYLGQSVLFVTSSLLAELDNFLHENAISHVVTKAMLGARHRCSSWV